MRTRRGNLATGGRGRGSGGRGERRGFGVGVGELGQQKRALWQGDIMIALQVTTGSAGGAAEPAGPQRMPS